MPLLSGRRYTTAWTEYRKMRTSGWKSINGAETLGEILLWQDAMADVSG